MSSLLPRSQITYRSRTHTKFIIVHDSHTLPEQSHLENFLARKGREMGLLEIGYHYLVLADGYVVCVRPHDKVGTHCHTYDRESVGICLAGGRKVIACEACCGEGSTFNLTPYLPAPCVHCDGTGKASAPYDTFPDAQKQGLVDLVQYLKGFYPEAELFGHTEMTRHSLRHNNKPCPMLDMDDIRERTTA